MEPERKITRLAIGVEGGFCVDEKKKNVEYLETYTVVRMPCFQEFRWPNPNLPETVHWF